MGIGSLAGGLFLRGIASVVLVSARVVAVSFLQAYFRLVRYQCVAVFFYVERGERM